MSNGYVWALNSIFFYFLKDKSYLKFYLRENFRTSPILRQRPFLSEMYFASNQRLSIDTRSSRYGSMNAMFT